MFFEKTLIRFVCELDAMRKRGVNDFGFLARATGNMGLPSSEMGKAVDGARSRLGQFRACEFIMVACYCSLFFNHHP